MDEAVRATVRRLVPLVRAGDAIAKDELCELLYRPTFRVLLQFARYLNSSRGAPLADSFVQELTHELVAEAFVSAFQQIDRYDPKRASFFTFLVWRGRALIKGVVVREIRHQESVTAVAISEGDPDADPIAVDPAAPDDVAMEALSRIGLREIEAVLAALPRDQARAIIEVYLRPRSDPRESRIAAAAREMSRSVPAMDSLLRRAIRNFRRIWEQENRERGGESR